jgi:hypothetical protein
MLNSPPLVYGWRRCHLAKDQLAKEAEIYAKTQGLDQLISFFFLIKFYIPLFLELHFQSFHPFEDENIKPSTKLTCLFHLTCD